MIDVIIPAYNAGKTIGRALASLAAQTDSDFRVTVVDDCSDEPIELEGIRCIRTPRNLGAGMARQYGIDHTDGEWITFLDADDVLMPYAIEAFKVMIANSPGTDMIHSAFYRQELGADGSVSLIELKRGWTWMHGKLYRRAFLEKYGIKNEPEFTRWADDSFFNAQCSELTPMLINELPMYIYTDTPGSVTSGGGARDKLIILLRAMYAAARHTLQFKNSVGHLANTLANIDRELAASGVPLSDAEREWYDKLRGLRCAARK